MIEKKENPRFNLGKEKINMAVVVVLRLEREESESVQRKGRESVCVREKKKEKGK